MAPEALQNWGHAFGPCYWDEEERVADAVAKLRRLRETGVTQQQIEQIMVSNPARFLVR